MIENAIPILNVSDMAASLAFYADILGFTSDWQAESDTDKIAGISRDGCALYLCEGSQGAPGSWIWLGVESEDFIERVAGSGVPIVQAATNYPWAYELRIQDPDGNVIRIGTEPRTKEG